NSFFDEDNFYIFADFSLYVYSDTVWEEYPILDLNYNPNYYHFTFLALNGLDCYFGTPDGLLHFNNGNLILVDTMITGIYGYDQDNKLWVFRRDNGLGNIFNSNYTPFNSIYSNTDLQDFRTTSPHEMYFGTNGNHIIHLGHDVILSFDNELWYFKYLVKNYSFLAFPDENEIWYRDSYDTITCIHTDELNFFATGIDNMYQYRNYKILDINNMSAPYHTWGNLYSIYSMYSGLNWPKDSLSDISADMGLLVGGLDSDQKIHLSTVRNRTHGCDFYPGPLDTTNATTDTATAFQYDRIWSVKQSEIELFIQKYNSGTLTGTWYKIPKDILEWPAAGSGNISRKLAPFIDNNADGVYNPYDGDYPDIEGNEMLWWVYNDNFAENTVTDARTLGIEIQARAWAFNHDFSVDSLKILNNCNFIHYDIINRSDTTYYDTYLGIYDYGCLPSDYGYNNYDIYAGCNVESASMYHYNFYPDSVYEQSTKMVEWISFLNGPLADENDGIDNDHDFDVDEPGETITMSAYVPSYCCPPIQPSCQQFTKEHYYNYLQGKRFNGEAFYYFDDYHVSADTSSQVITKYVFPDDSNPNGWGQNGIAMPPWNESGNWMDTRINFGSLGPFTFYPGQKVSLDIVIGA
ncbi:MAG: hypothetical protein U9R19_15760, partial [Bacteroidota bacterium]|nr:hypothetical protein [Bacteroidota bacterium]